MANEISFSNSVTITKSDISESLSAPGNVSMTDTAFLKETQLVPTASTAINLGTLATIGKYLIQNTDTTNYVSLLTSTAGTTFTKLLAGDSTQGYFSSNVTAPAAIANSASVRIKYIIAPV